MDVWKSISRQYNAAYLVFRHSIFGLAEACIAPGLHLHDDKHTASLAHNIEFLVSAAPVAVYDMIALTRQIVGRFVLASATQFVMLRHFSKL